MDERNVIGGAFAMWLSWAIEFIHPLRWLLLVGAVLIVVDLRFGIRAARVRKEKIRPSRAARRTINKMVDYLCWLFLSGAIGAAFGDVLGVKVLPVAMMGIIYVIELNSCFGNYFESRGSKVKVDLFKIFKQKTGIEIDENK